MDAKQGGRFWLIFIPGVTLAVMAASFLLSPVGCGGGAAARVALYAPRTRSSPRSRSPSSSSAPALEVAPKFDTEKDKSVGLYTELVKEKDRPRCDVFWNNEILDTIRLQRQGLLEPYDSPSAKPYPDRGARRPTTPGTPSPPAPASWSSTRTW